MAGNRPGRSDRGKRTVCTARIPDDHLSQYKATADELGLSMSEYIVWCLAEHHDFDVPTYIKEAINSTQLRLGA